MKPMTAKQCIKFLTVAFVVIFALPATILIIGCTTASIDRVKDLIDAIPEKPVEKPQEPPPVRRWLYLRGFKGEVTAR